MRVLLKDTSVGQYFNLGPLTDWSHSLNPTQILYGEMWVQEREFQILGAIDSILHALQMVFDSRGSMIFLDERKTLPHSAYLFYFV